MRIPTSHFRPALAPLASVLLAFAAPVRADSVPCVGSAVTMEIRTDDGRQLPFYRAPGRPGASRFYMEAVQGDRYNIVARNNLGRRVGLVIAVDGRNILSGKKSDLANNEQMYILEPYSSGEYSGWRTAQDKVNRFYFTTVADSYAAAFKDESAMGVIAVAVYQEVVPPTPIVRSWLPRRSADSERSDSPASAAPPSPSAAGSLSAQEAAPRMEKEKKSAPGTGYGEDQYSPSYRVSFQAQSVPQERIFVKYEWRSTLCRLGVIPAERPSRPENRFWDGEFAPPPPHRGSR